MAITLHRGLYKVAVDVRKNGSLAIMLGIKEHGVCIHFERPGNSLGRYTL